jgi:hypothetical protein
MFDVDNKFIMVNKPEIIIWIILIYWKQFIAAFLTGDRKFGLLQHGVRGKRA